MLASELKYITVFCQWKTTNNLSGGLVMTVQTKVDDGISIKTRTYRDIYKTKGLAELREGFYGQREHCRWGVMIQLKGKERILLGSFGDLDEALKSIGGTSIVLPNVKVPDDRIFYG
jgi:hypothetical protein